MFLAPLNYDKYFNKVFSNERIAKRYLEYLHEYLGDEIFREIMKRLDRKELTDDDFSYIQDEKKIWEEVERFEQEIYKEGEKNKALEIAKRLKEKEFDDDLIAAISGLSPDELTRL